MALTKIQTIGIETGVSLSGVTTVVTLNATGNATFSGNVSIAGTLTYEDVSNIDAIGLITARSGIEFGTRPGLGASISDIGNAVFAGVVTATSFSGDGSALTGVAATDNVRTGILDVAGVGTFRSDVNISDSIIHLGDTNTKIRFPAADTVTVETGGSERARIDSSGNFGLGTASPSRKLHVDSGSTDTAALFYSSDAGVYINFQDSTSAASGVTIGGTGDDLRFGSGGGGEFGRFDSSGRLLVGKSSTSKDANSLFAGSSTSAAAHIYIVSDSAGSNGDELGAIRFGDNSHGTNAQISSNVDGGTGTPGNLIFSTTPDASSTTVERMRIGSTGNVGINTTNLSGNQTLNLASDYLASSSNLTNSGLTFQSFTTPTTGQVYPGISWAGNPANLARSRAAITAVATNANNASDLVFMTRSASDGTGLSVGTDEKMRIDSSGVLRLGTGTIFTATKMAIAIPSNSTNGIFMGPTSTPVSGAFLGSVYFGNAGRTDGESCSIEAIATGTHDPGTHNRGKLQFRTCSSTTTDPDIRLTIDEDGVMIKAGNSSSARIVPQTDNAGYIGESSHRWQAIYAVNGTIQTSDEREKTEIVDSPLGTDFIKSLHPVAYKWKVGGYDHAYDEDRNDIFTPVAGTRTHYGFIAQEVRQAVGDTDFGGWLMEDVNDPDSKQSLRLHEFISPMVKALQEAITKIETLEARLDAAGL